MEFTVKHQELAIISSYAVSDSIDYLEAVFHFRTNDWQGLVKWAHFAQGETVYDIQLTDDRILKKDHLNLGKGIWSVYLHGNSIQDGQIVERITTSIVKIQVLPTGILNGEPLPDIPPSASEQILATATEAKNIAQSVYDDAERGLFDGFSPTIEVKAETASEYILTITDKQGSFDTPNLKGSGGGMPYVIGDGLKLEGDTISVDTATEVEEDNTKPVTSGAVYVQLGNVEILLSNI